MKSKLDHIEIIITKNKKEMSFDQIAKQLSKRTGNEYNSGEISAIFTDLNIDKRFIHLGDNIWDLRINHPYEKVHLPINEIYENQKAEEAKVTTKIDSDVKSFVNNK